MSSTRTTRLVLTCFAVLTLALCARVGAAGSPNVVWIIADDMSPDTAAYGVSQVHTPHLDGLGASGDPATEPSLDQIQRQKRADYQRAWKSRLQKPEPTDAERLAWCMKSYGLE